ncbi:MAG: hypothetical protein WCL18_00840 [bacterium]
MPERIIVVPEYISNRPDVVMGSKVIEAKTPVSSHAIVVVLQVNVCKGTPIRLRKANDPVFGV